MKLDALKSFGKKRRRVGRGISAGQGKTAGRGTKGQKSRSGKTLKPGFEGGQTPFLMRIPKLKGFRNPNRVEFQVVNVCELEKVDGEEVTKEFLYKKGLISKIDTPVKILGNGDLSKKCTVTVEKASASAVEKIQKAGGSFTSLLPVLEVSVENK